MTFQNDTTDPGQRFFRRWVWVWHGLMYIALVIALGDAFLFTPRPPSEVIPIVVLSALLAGWYAICIVTKYEVFRQNLPLLLGYVAVGWAIWFWLTYYEGMFLLLLVGLYPQIFGMLPTRWKIIGTVILTTLSVWRQSAMAGYISWIYLIIMVISAVATLALALLIEALIHQGERQRRLIEELRAARDDLAAAERQAGILQERQRLAREIHDTLAQGFTSIILHLEAVEAASEPAVAHRHLQQARQIARDSLSEARRMVWALQPESLEQASLIEALQRSVKGWAEETAIEAALTVTGKPQPLPPEFEVTLLRAAQEALANIRKHACARHVNLTLSYMGDLVTMDIQDDGQGFDPSYASGRPNGQAAGGFGLRSMRERVETLGGTLTIESAPREGTTLAIALPLTAGGAPALSQAAHLEENG
jgi:signal transduction histidine kinase